MSRQQNNPNKQNISTILQYGEWERNGDKRGGGDYSIELFWQLMSYLVPASQRWEFAAFPRFTQQYYEYLWVLDLF